MNRQQSMIRYAAVVGVVVLAGFAHAAKREVSGTESFPATEGKKVLVDVADLNVTVRTADVREIEVTTDIRISGVGEEKAESWVTDHTPQMEDSPTELRLRAERAQHGFLGLGLLTARAKLSMVIPMDAVPDITTTGGEIELRGDFAHSRPLRLRTATGDMELTGAAPEIRIHTSDGDSRIDVVRPLDRLFVRTASGGISLVGGARSAEVDTASGTVWLDNLSGSVRVQNSTGKVTLRWDRLDADATVQVETSSGKVRLIVPDGTAASGTLRTTSGRIRCDLPGTVNEAGDTVELAGGGPTLDVVSVTGEILVTTAESWEDTRAREERNRPLLE